MEHWPSDFPKPRLLKLYVRADQAELWNIWANHHIPYVQVVVIGVQHYTVTGSKNSADINLALDALADLLKDRTKYIAIMSDDSDYASLFATAKRELDLTDNAKIPFKWFVTNVRTPVHRYSPNFPWRILAYVRLLLSC